MSDPFIKIIPSPFLNDIPRLRVGDIEITGFAAVRRYGDAPLTLFSPYSAHLNTLRRRLEEVKNQLFFNILTPGSSSQFVSIALAWLEGQVGSLGDVIRYNQQTVNDMWPIPGLQELYYDYRGEGGSSGTATFHIPDPILAEIALYILQDAAFKRDKVFQAFIPILVSDGGSTTWRLSPAIGGPITEVEWSDWPYGITVRFGDMGLFLDSATATPEEGSVVTGKTPRELLNALFKRAGVIPIYFPVGGALDAVLERTLKPPYQVDIAERPIRDVITEQVRALGLNIRWHMGFGSIVPPIAWVYDPARTPWNDTNGILDTARAIAASIDDWVEEFAAVRWFAKRLGLEAYGVINALAPFYLDPEQARQMTLLYEKGAVGNAVINLASRIALNAFYPERDITNIIGDWANEFAQILLRNNVNNLRVNLSPIYGIEYFRFRTPSAKDLEAGAVGGPFGFTTIRAADAAGKGALGITRKGSYYELEGGQRVDANTPVILQPGTGISAPRVVGIAGGQAGLATGEAAKESPALYEMAVRIPPVAPTWAGFPALMLGMRPLDGWWEPYRSEFVINAHEQHIIVHLRTNRLVVYTG